jgi:hypothetical protein
MQGHVAEEAAVSRQEERSAFAIDARTAAFPEGDGDTGLVAEGFVEIAEEALEAALNEADAWAGDDSAKRGL